MRVGRMLAVLGAVACLAVCATAMAQPGGPGGPGRGPGRMMGGPMGNPAMLLQGEYAEHMGPGVPPRAVLEEMRKKLYEGASESEWAYNLAAINFAVKNGLISGSSPAAQFLERVRRQGYTDPIGNTVVIDLLKRSGFPGGAQGAAYFVGHRAGLKNWMSPEIVDAVFKSQRYTSEQRAEAYVKATMPRGLSPKQQAAYEKLLKEHFYQEYLGYLPNTFDIIHPKSRSDNIPSNRSRPGEQ